jgi:hypothetical protein
MRHTLYPDVEEQRVTMKIQLNEAARGLVRTRRARNQKVALWIHTVRTPKSGYVAAVDWTDSPPPGALPAEIGEITVWIDRRIATYAQWRPIKLIAGGFGPFRSLLIDNPLLMFQIADWERNHPGLIAA